LSPKIIIPIATSKENGLLHDFIGKIGAVSPGGAPTGDPLKT
jgi:hypothetical protein